MKAHEFKEVIRSLVIEEVQKEVSKQLPKLLFEMLGQQSKTIVRESSPVGKPTQPRPQVQRQVAPQAPKPMKKFVKDPILNAILNETTPGLPQTPYADVGVPIPVFDKVGESEQFMGEMQQLLNEGSDPIEIQPQVSEEQFSGPDLSKLFNKDFKAILNKSKECRGGNFSKVIQNW